MTTETLTTVEEIIRWKATARRSLMPDAAFLFDEWLLEHGERFGAPIKRRGTGYRLGQKKMCYQNSFQAVTAFDADPDWFYTEGVVWRSGLPIEIDHAWLSNRNGDVLDLTLRDQSPDDQYFGVPFTKEYVIEQTIKHGYYRLFSNGVLYNTDVMESVAEGRAWKKGER